MLLAPGLTLQVEVVEAVVEAAAHLAVDVVDAVDAVQAPAPAAAPLSASSSATAVLVAVAKPDVKATADMAGAPTTLKPTLMVRLPLLL